MFRESRPFYDMEVVIIAARLCGNLENEPSRRPGKGNECKGDRGRGLGSTARKRVQPGRLGKKWPLCELSRKFDFTRGWAGKR
jgi:hypothetical protein